MYSCYNAKASNYCDISRRTVFGISNNHMKGKSNYDVKMFYIQKQEIPAVPIDIGKFFPNLEVVRMPYLGLLKVCRMDLKQFPKVRFLYLSYNKIKQLDNNLFEYTPALEFIALDHNELTNIGQRIFDNLPNVHRFYVERNPCVYIGHVETREDLEKFKSLLQTECPQAQPNEEETVQPENFTSSSLDDTGNRNCHLLYSGLPTTIVNPNGGENRRDGLDRDTEERSEGSNLSEESDGDIEDENEGWKGSDGSYGGTEKWFERWRFGDESDGDTEEKDAGWQRDEGWQGGDVSDGDTEEKDEGWQGGDGDTDSVGEGWKEAVDNRMLVYRTAKVDPNLQNLRKQSKTKPSRNDCNRGKIIIPG